MRPVPRILAIDYGRARIGLATCDPETGIAFPHETYERKSLAADLGFLKKLTEQQGINLVLLGLPLHTDGRLSRLAEEVIAFAAQLAQQLPIPMTYWDERFTTVQAESALWRAGLSHQRRKERRDKVAAQILLQSYLDAGCPPDGTPLPEGSPPLNVD